jgi:hypothetical protein
MAKQTVTMPGYMGKPWEVEGDVESGLILHKIGSTWNLSHVATGSRVGVGRKLQKDAKAVRARLFAILPDWSAPTIPDLAAAAGMDARAFSDAVRAAAYDA